MPWPSSGVGLSRCCQASHSPVRSCQPPSCRWSVGSLQHARLRFSSTPASQTLCRRWHRGRHRLSAACGTQPQSMAWSQPSKWSNCAAAACMSTFGCQCTQHDMRGSLAIVIQSHAQLHTFCYKSSLLAKMTADTDSMTWRRLNIPTAEQGNLKISSEDQREADTWAKQRC